VPVWKRVTALTAAAVVGGGLASAIVWRFRPAARATVVRFTVPLPEGQDFTNAGRLVVAISPDGTRVVYVANQRLYGRAMWDAEARPIAGTDLGGSVLNPVFSPDGEMVAFWSSPDATIRRVAFVGGAAVTVAKTGAPAG
jgi:hypothetical protein